VSLCFLFRICKTTKDLVAVTDFSAQRFRKHRFPMTRESHNEGPGCSFQRDEAAAYVPTLPACNQGALIVVRVATETRGFSLVPKGQFSISEIDVLHLLRKGENIQSDQVTFPLPGGFLFSFIDGEASP